MTPLTEINARRILVVEDEMLIAMNFEELLAELGHTVIAVATRLPQALTLAADSDIDFAILDLNLAGSLTFPVAEVLRKRGAPFMFASGYGTHGLIDGYHDVHLLPKPFGLEELEKTIKLALSTVVRP